jgi:glycosyltransferase involved in cell wall biosynthesis
MLLSVVIPCFNEQDNVEGLHERLAAVLSDAGINEYELIFIDNASTDATVERVKRLAAADKRVKLIVNVRNFGHIRSPYHGILQARGQAVVCMAADFQDPPEMLPTFIAKWREGYKVVAAIKQESLESKAMWAIRSVYYRLARSMADVGLLEHFTGFGLYDQSVVQTLRGLDDPYPYFRGIIAELGFEVAKVPYIQPRRARGITKNNFYSLYDMAMLGITSHSKVPIRLATMLGFTLAAVSLVVSLVYLALKLLFWNQFQLGTAPLLIGFYFFASVQLLFIGLIGEYVAVIHTRVMKRPLVIEKERVNFDAS